MEEVTIKLSIRALAANENLSVEKLAEKCDLDPGHLRNVSLGRATMTARELVNLSIGCNVSPFMIQIP